MATNELIDNTPRLFIGKVSHQRFFPVRYRFTYRVFSIAVNIDKLEETFSRSKFISLNKWNLFSFYQADFGPKGKMALRPWVNQSLLKAGISIQPDNIELFCFPRVLGYSFNPLAIWYCYKDSQLIAAILEVHNTFKEAHTYVINCTQAKTLTGKADKSFHVSPFISMDARYQFTLKDNPTIKIISIHQYQEDNLLLIANQYAKEIPFSSSNLLKVFLSIPLMTWKVIVMIHWQALKIWLKGATFYPHPNYRNSKD
ncbi:DUF1365 domain-containing protein [Spartinivicinus poritis]|uniref:DUF1365 domain-containing protein n=1 Tax=Spartinivicinus poritis TaxID=2994640 RepID=A0ABT5UHB6_9GAMM|nr:DUF1365 domain-containing protein [Spartinivicinus sp. A2-2]MDE1465787.1 DUF1365 domain-containing protein [Spartinivicinus sp. A2-2]